LVEMNPAQAGDVSVAVAANAAHDAAGNGNPASNTVTRTFETTGPTATLFTPSSNPTSDTAIPFSVSFNEDVTGFGVAGLMVINGTVSNFEGVTAREYTFDITPGGD